MKGEFIQVNGDNLFKADLVKVLLTARADVHAVGAGGETAWMAATRGGHDEVLSVLRAAGAEATEVPPERPGDDVEAPRR